MSHVAVCPAYQPLRVGKDLDNDKDLAEYMAAVMVLRSKKKFWKWIGFYELLPLWVGDNFTLLYFPTLKISSLVHIVFHDIFYVL